MNDRLHVELFERPVGEVGISGSLRSPEDWTFAYEPQYLASPAPVSLSVGLPLRAEPFSGALVRNWFCNLLPEGPVREAIETRLRIPARDDFALLAAIGGECAGAVSIGQRSCDGDPAPDEETDLETLLYLQGHDAGEGAWASLGTPHRLSLAGAQDKIAVVVEPDGRLRLPARNEFSTHILKPDSRRFRGLRDLEALGLALARAAGLDVCNAALVEVSGRNALLVERFDRAPGPDGTIDRLHQEDFCQALGYPAEMKYESQGGPTLARCSNLIRQLALGPIALAGFLDWVVFNAVIGNADAHGKNLSMLCGPDGRRKLAPGYDLVPTIAIPESLIERSPALRIGNAARIDAIAAGDWRGFATQAGYAPRYVLDRVAATTTVVLDVLNATGGQVIANGANAARIERALRTIGANAERMREGVGARGITGKASRV
ncbi:MAG: type II toxin-antitoxin system HipA family toxin [Pseudomonadota bacterium]|nr:type II toxin-antitoxin system HipA family toxin [Pseudomonadota bacterium]